MPSHQLPGEVTVSQRQYRQWAAQRREIIRGLLAKGYSPKYGFQKLVGELCKKQGIPYSKDALHRDVKRCMEEIKKDEWIQFGKQRVLDILGQQLMDLAQLPNQKKADGTPNEAVVIGRARAMAKILDQIADLEGLKAPKEHKHSFAGVMAVLNGMPEPVATMITDATDDEQVIKILEEELGQEQAGLLLDAFAEE